MQKKWGGPIQLTRSIPALYYFTYLYTISFIYATLQDSLSLF